MALLVLLALGLLAAIIVHRIFSAVVRVLAFALLSALSAALAVMTGLVIASLSLLYPIADASTVGIVAGAISLPVWLLVLGARGSHRPPRGTAEAVALDATPSAGEDTALAAAWDSASAMLPMYHARLLKAREASRALLVQSEADPLDLALLESAVLIRKHVPALVLKAAAIWPSLDGQEKKQHATDMMIALEQLSEAGKRVREEQQQSLREDFRSLLRHVRARTRASD